MKTIIAVASAATGCLMTALGLAVAGTVALSTLVLAGVFIALMWGLALAVIVLDFVRDIVDTDTVLKDTGRKHPMDDS